MNRLATPEAQTAKAVRAIEHYELTWCGIAVRIVYEPQSIGPAHCVYAHLEVMTERPRRPLPMTETGYQSLFLPAGTIEAHGGPVTYVTRWLDHAARSPQWKAMERDRRQGSLF